MQRLLIVYASAPLLSRTGTACASVGTHYPSAALGDELHRVAEQFDDITHELEKYGLRRYYRDGADVGAVYHFDAMSRRSRSQSVPRDQVRSITQRQCGMDRRSSLLLNRGCHNKDPDQADEGDDYRQDGKRMLGATR